jgi:DNA-directed RNA polymerase specialized sigma24 family protein
VDDHELTSAQRRPQATERAFGALEDEDLIAAFYRGQPGAFEELVHRYEQPLRGFFARKDSTLNREEEDLTQDVFTKIFCTRDAVHTRYDPEKGTFKAWAFGIASNCYRDDRRRKRSRPQPTSLEVGVAGTTATGGTPDILGKEEFLRPLNDRERLFVNMCEEGLDQNSTLPGTCPGPPSGA